MQPMARMAFTGLLLSAFFLASALLGLGCSSGSSTRTEAVIALVREALPNANVELSDGGKKVLFRVNEDRGSIRNVTAGNGGPGTMYVPELRINTAVMVDKKDRFANIKHASVEQLRADPVFQKLKDYLQQEPSIMNPTENSRYASATFRW